MGNKSLGTEAVWVPERCGGAGQIGWIWLTPTLVPLVEDFATEKGNLKLCDIKKYMSKLVR